jgi:hypothetical protein
MREGVEPEEDLMDDLPDELDELDPDRASMPSYSSMRVYGGQE